MSRPTTESAEPPFDEAAFQAALTYLLGEAYENGIEVDGTWSCATNESLPDWGVEIFEVGRQADP